MIPFKQVSWCFMCRYALARCDQLLGRTPEAVAQLKPLFSPARRGAAFAMSFGPVGDGGFRQQQQRARAAAEARAGKRQRQEAEGERTGAEEDGEGKRRDVQGRVAGSRGRRASLRGGRTPQRGRGGASGSGGQQRGGEGEQGRGRKRLPVDTDDDDQDDEDEEQQGAEQQQGQGQQGGDGGEGKGRGLEQQEEGGGRDSDGEADERERKRPRRVEGGKEMTLAARGLGYAGTEAAGGDGDEREQPAAGGEVQEDGELMYPDLRKRVPTALWGVEPEVRMQSVRACLPSTCGLLDPCVPLLAAGLSRAVPRPLPFPCCSF